MAQAVYRRQGMSFKAYIHITANVGDKVSVGGPDGYFYQFDMPEIGNITLAVKTKGNYSVSASTSGLSVNIEIDKRRATYEADVSFIQTVTVNTNPKAVVTFTNYSGSTVSYKAAADDKGIAVVTVYRKGEYDIASSVETNGTILSTSPKSVDKYVCNTNKGSTKINHVRVAETTSISAGIYSSSNLTAYVYWILASTELYSGVKIQYKKDTYPLSLTDGTTLGDGLGEERTVKYGVTAKSFISGSLQNGVTYFFMGTSYININGVKYYATIRQASCHVTYKNVNNATHSSSGSMVVPDGCRNISFHLVGGGGGGANGAYYNGGGGGGGGRNVNGSGTVTPGETISWSVGGGGSPGGTGGSTTIWYNNTSASAGGGNGGWAGYVNGAYNGGGDGGAGGGCGSHYRSDSSDKYWSAGSGGSKGGNASSPSDGTDKGYGGKGQGEATVTFNGTIYSGGGGGGGYWNHYGGSGGNRGGGAGGYKGNNNDIGPGSGGSSGSGGGGGGGAGSGNRNVGGGAGGWGGSGAIIISLW